MDFQSLNSKCLFHSPGQNISTRRISKISQQGESVCCKYFARSLPSARTMKLTKSVEFGRVVQE